MRRQTPRNVVIGLMLVAGLATSACGSDRPDTPRVGRVDRIEVVDAAERAWTLDGPARRIISLVPSATSTLKAMGAESVLVGRTDFDTDPWVTSLPSVGGGLEPNIEVIISLDPDLVIRFAGEQDPVTAARLDDLGIPHLAVRPDRLEDIMASVELLGRVTGFEAEADSLIDSIRTGLAELAARTKSLPRQRVAYVMGTTPAWVAGPGTYIDEIMSLVGGDNAFSDLGTLYAVVSLEELRSRPIDVVLVPDRSAFDASVTPDARVEEVGETLEMPGPGVVDAARLVARLIHRSSVR